MTESNIAFELTSHQWKILIIIVFSTGALALFIYYYGFKYLPASHATIYELAWPLSAVFLDWFVHGQIFTPTQFFGAIILMASMFTLSRTGKNG